MIGDKKQADRRNAALMDWGSSSGSRPLPLNFSNLKKTSFHGTRAAPCGALSLSQLSHGLTPVATTLPPLRGSCSNLGLSEGPKDRYGFVGPTVRSGYRLQYKYERRRCGTTSCPPDCRFPKVTDYLISRRRRHCWPLASGF